MEPVGLVIPPVRKDAIIDSEAGPPTMCTNCPNWTQTRHALLVSLHIVVNFACRVLKVGRVVHLVIRIFVPVDKSQIRWRQLIQPRV